MNVRRVIFWLLAAGYLVGSLWWLVYVPHQPERLLRAIPGQATLVSWHDQLADRWETVSSHPVVMMAVGASGGDVGEWEALRTDPGFLTVVDLAGRHETVLALVPHMGSERQPHWVMASWIGGRSQILQWAEPFLDLPNLERVGDLGNWPVWTWSWETDAGPQSLTFALVEGMLLGTTAQDLETMNMIIDTYNGGFPSIVKRPDVGAWNNRLLKADQPSRAWYRYRPFFTEPVYWFGGLDFPDAGAMNLSLFSTDLTPPGDLPASFDLDGLAGFWGEAPIATALFGIDLPVRSLGNLVNPATALVREVLVGSGAESVALGLFGGPYSGRLKVIQVPTLMAGLHRTEGMDPEVLVRQTADRLNAQYRAGLVPVLQVVGGYPVWRFEGVAGGLYASLSAPEQLAVTAVGNWLVVASNFGALERLINDRVAEGASSAPPPAWVTRMNDLADRGGLGYLGFDLAGGAPVFQLSLKAYAAKLAFENFRGTRQQRQQLNEARAWVDTLAKLNRLDVTAFVNQDEVRIDLTAGP